MSRSFFCRSCKATADADDVPHGWYSLNRHTGGETRPLRLGLYCGSNCLDDAMGAIAMDEAVMGESWADIMQPGLR